MRKILLGLFTIIQVGVNAQITLDHTFVNKQIINTNTHLKTVYFDSAPINNQINFYNENYTFYKTTTITPPTGYKLNNITNVSDQLFNTDNLLEFTCLFIDTLNNTGYNLKLINENGVELFDFGNAYYGYAHKTVTNQTRFIVWNYTNYPNPNIETNIYSIPGTIVTGKNSIENDFSNNNPFPNPATSYINLKYNINQSEVTDLSIYKSNGQLIETMKIGGDFNTIKLDISKYSKGIYFYKYNSESKKFIVQ
jgi:hypothetical protein